MTDISVIILVGNEALHIRRCLERLAPLEPKQVFIVESQHGDNTHDLAIEAAKCLKWRVEEYLNDVHQNSNISSTLITIFHPWPGLQSIQFNWALDNLPVEGAWVLRLDADEYLTDEGVVWLKENIDSVPVQFDMLEFTLERKFCGGAIRHGTNGIPMVRMFRRGTARYAEGLMDERLVSSRCSTLPVPVTFYDDSLMPMSVWRTKHRDYAKREAQQALASISSGQWADPRKAAYYRLPPYIRALAYFCIRYFLKGGILDGFSGWMWNFWQGLWYRCLVDREIDKLRRK